MGFLDDMVKDFNSGDGLVGLGGLLQDNPQLAQAAQAWLSADSDVGPGGGLPEILEQLQASGLGDLVASWLGSGENRAVSAAELSNALGPDSLNQFAEKAGIDLGQAASVLAGLLPQLVDQLSPQGSLPEQQGLEGLLGGLLGKG